MSTEIHGKSNRSESIAKLAEALSKAQGEIRNASKDALNPHFNRSYADLANVWDACREPLSKHGLAVVQIPGFSAGMATVLTVLMHTSGEWIEGELGLVPVKPDPQGVGSALTYARRYSLSAFAGIAPEDDDGNAASGKDAKDKPKAENKTSQSTTIGKPPVLPLPNANAEYISPEQLTRFHAMTAERKWSRDDAKAMLSDFGVQSSKYILKKDYERICNIITNQSYVEYQDYKQNPPAKAV